MKRITNILELTPIEEYNGLFFKRDDLYLPFKSQPELGGGKVRQMQSMYNNIIKNNENIKGLITYPVSLSSPQSAIVAKVAKDNNVPCMICFGGKIESIEDTINKYKPLKLSYQLGAHFNVVAKIGYSSVISSRVKEIVKENNYKIVDFGINLSEYPDAIIGSTADQVQNLPDNLDNLIIPCGSALTMAGIILGINKFKKKVNRIIGIQISNRDRRKSIDSILKQFDVIRNYEFYIDNTYSYQKNTIQFINSEFELNVKYESKAIKYFLRNKKELGILDSENNLFWCVGNNNFIFN